MNRTLRGLAVLGLAAALVGTATGCGLASRGQAAPARPHAVTRPAKEVAARESAATPPASAQSAAPSAQSPSSSPSTPAASGYTGPHFSSPTSAMIYLARAYNGHDITALRAVTTPQSYRELMQMQSEAVNLQLRYCTPDPGRGDYTCYFRHDYPASAH